MFKSPNIFVQFESTKGIYKYHIYDICAYSMPKELEIELVQVEKIEIIAPSSVPSETEFEYRLKLYGRNGYEIPERFVKDIEAPKINKESKHLPKKNDYFVYSITSPKSNTMTITAQIGSVKAQKEISVIPPIVLSPKTIILLPGQTCELFLVSGPQEISLGSHDTNIISLSGRTITALKPGTTKILGKVRELLSAAPCEVTVIVPKPLNLIVEPSTDVLIEGGHLALDLFVNTDYGLFVCPTASWIVPKNFASESDKDLE